MFCSSFRRFKRIFCILLNFCRQSSCCIKVRDLCSLETYAAAAAAAVVLAIWQTFNS
jgi:hypothetical protein